MKHPHFSFLRLLSFAALVLLFSAGEAQARRRGGFRLYTFGPTISELGPLRQDALQKLDSGAKVKSQAPLRGLNTVGFRYKHFGLFWLDIWSWGGHYAVYNSANDDFEEVSPSIAASLMGIEESKLSKPLSYHIPWGLVIILGLAALKIIPRLIAKRRYARQQAAQATAIPEWTPPPPGIVPPPPGYSPPAQPPGGSGPPPVPPPLPPDQS